MTEHDKGLDNDIDHDKNTEIVQAVHNFITDTERF